MQFDDLLVACVSHGRCSRHPKLNDWPFIEKRRKGQPDEKLSPNHDDYTVGPTEILGVEGAAATQFISFWNGRARERRNSEKTSNTFSFVWIS